MHNVYVFRNRLTGSFTLPECRYEQPEDYDKGLSRFIIVNPEKAFQQHYDELELYHLGKYDDESAKIILFDEPVMVNNYGPLCEQVKRRMQPDGVN